MMLENFPRWMANAERHYIMNTVCGLSYREISKLSGNAPSTIMRQIRRVEKHRDDLIFDNAIRDFEASHREYFSAQGNKAMSKSRSVQDLNEDKINAEGLRILRRLNETNAFLAITDNISRGAVFRSAVPGKPVRTAYVELPYIKAFLLKDWISLYSKGKVSKYRITHPGQLALKRLIAQRQKKRKESGAVSEFQEQHQDIFEAAIESPYDGGVVYAAVNAKESPLMSLSRKRNKDGSRFITYEQLQAGERLREDFEYAQLGPKVCQNWTDFLTAGVTTSKRGGDVPDSAEAARQSIAAALNYLGPGLSDIALRCCCFLEGLEVAEQRLGWSARSGKVVLRIALERLAVFYDLKAKQKKAAPFEKSRSEMDECF